MAIALKESPFESEMAIAPPLACGMTPLGAAVSANREPVWGLSTSAPEGGSRVLIAQVVLEDMALISRLREVPDLPIGGNDRIWGIGGNEQVIWVIGSTVLGGSEFRNGRLYDINPRDFRIRRDTLTPSLRSDRNLPVRVAGDNHTVWVYQLDERRIYKMSASDFRVEGQTDLWVFGGVTGDREGFWSIRADLDYPQGQQIRLVYITAAFAKQVDVEPPLYEYGATGPNRKVLNIVATGGKHPDTGRDRALIFQTHQDDEGVRTHLIETEEFAVLRSTAAWQDIHGSVQLGR